jgi:hypothetical protein
MKIRILMLATCLALTGLAQAKLPPPSEEQAAKAAETKAKAAEADTRAATELNAAQDKVAARWIAAQKAKGITVTPTPVAPATPATVTPASAHEPPVKAPHTPPAAPSK